MREQHAPGNDGARLWTTGAKLEAVRNKEPRFGKLFGSGEANHLRADIHADSPGKGRKDTGHDQPRRATCVDDPMGAAEVVSLLDHQSELVQETPVSVVRVEMTCRVRQVAVPVSRLVVPARSYSIHLPPLVNVVDFP